MEPIPHAVFEAAVSVAGEALHWKDSLRQLLRSSGVSENGYERYADRSKYQIMRNIWADLDRAGDRGGQVQRRIVQELANLDTPDPHVPDVAAGRDAIANLRRLATDASLLVRPEEAERSARRAAAQQSRTLATTRGERLRDLNADFLAFHSDSDKQRRGYQFEKLLAALFRLEELDYHGAYKTDTDQVDGAVVLDSFTYLLEARWRQVVASDADLAALTHKVERRLDATRGLFISMAGFRDEAVQLYRLAKENRLILMDGQDLTWVLEGRIGFADALRAKVGAATIEGNPYLRLANL